MKKMQGNKKVQRNQSNDEIKIYSNPLHNRQRLMSVASTTAVKPVEASNQTLGSRRRSKSLDGDNKSFVPVTESLNFKALSEHDTFRSTFNVGPQLLANHGARKEALERLLVLTKESLASLFETNAMQDLGIVELKNKRISIAQAIMDKHIAIAYEKYLAKQKQSQTSNEKPERIKFKATSEKFKQERKQLVNKLADAFCEAVKQKKSKVVTDNDANSSTSTELKQETDLSPTRAFDFVELPKELQIHIDKDSYVNKIKEFDDLTAKIDQVLEERRVKSNEFKGKLFCLFPQVGYPGYIRQDAIFDNFLIDMGIKAGNFNDSDLKKISALLGKCVYQVAYENVRDEKNRIRLSRVAKEEDQFLFFKIGDELNVFFNLLATTLGIARSNEDKIKINAIGKVLEAQSETIIGKFKDAVRGWNQSLSEEQAKNEINVLSKESNETKTRTILRR